MWACGFHTHVHTCIYTLIYHTCVHKPQRKKKYRTVVLLFQFSHIELIIFEKIIPKKSPSLKKKKELSSSKETYQNDFPSSIYV